MKKICKECPSDGKWFPSSVSSLERFLSKFIEAGNGVPNVVGLRKNIAYNLQYLQFQKQVLIEFDVTQVILTQVWKVHIIVGTSIVEAILYYLLTSKSLQKTTKWEQVGSASNETNINGEKHRIENVIFKELDAPINQEMTLDVMIFCLYLLFIFFTIRLDAWKLFILAADVAAKPKTLSIGLRKSENAITITAIEAEIVSSIVLIIAKPDSTDTRK